MKQLLENTVCVIVDLGSNFLKVEVGKGVGNQEGVDSRCYEATR